MAQNYYGHELQMQICPAFLYSFFPTKNDRTKNDRVLQAHKYCLSVQMDVTTSTEYAFSGMDPVGFPLHSAFLYGDKR